MNEAEKVKRITRENADRVFQRVYCKIMRLKNAMINVDDYIVKITPEEYAWVKAFNGESMMHKITDTQNGLDGEMFGMSIKVVGGAK